MAFQQVWGYSGFLLPRGPRIGWALAWEQPVATSTLRSRTPPSSQLCAVVGMRIGERGGWRNGGCS